MASRKSEGETTTSRSMTGFAARPVTAVLPTCSIRPTRSPSEAFTLAASAAKLCACLASYSSMKMEGRSLMFRKVAFTMYPVTDVPRARQFYEETLGLKRGSMGNQGEHYWIEY